MKLSQEKRIELIKQLLEERQELSTRDIMTEFGVSQDTARRDIVLLTKKGEVKRTHGGILPLDLDAVCLITKVDYHVLLNLKQKSQWKQENILSHIMYTL